MKIDITPVGHVRCGVKRRHDMSMGGVPSTIDIEPQFRAALTGLKACSHIWVLCWFDQADRTVLKARPRKISSTAKARGVFAMRSPDRPNPVALTCARLVKIKGLTLTLDCLDAADGTPVLDIKPYSKGIDCVPVAAATDFSAKYRKLDDNALARQLAKMARNYTAAITPEVIKALALTLAYIRKTGLAPEGGAQALAATVSNEGLDVLAGLFGLKPSEECKRLAGARPTLKVKTETGRITVQARQAELDKLGFLTGQARCASLEKPFKKCQSNK